MSAPTATKAALIAAYRARLACGRAGVGAAFGMGGPGCAGSAHARPDGRGNPSPREPLTFRAGALRRSPSEGQSSPGASRDTQEMMMQKECHFMPGVNRYAFDFRTCHYKKGWAQCDTSQDASYFGIWTNPFSLKIVTFAEGDLTVQTAANEAEYREAVRAMAGWYRDNDQWRGIDGMCHGQIITRMQALGLGELLH